MKDLINLEVEKRLLSCMFLDRTKVPEINPEAFTNPIHRAIYIKYKELVDDGLTPDDAVMSTYLASMAQRSDLTILSGINILDFLADIISMEVSSCYAPSYIKLLEELAFRRELARAIIDANKSYVLKRDAYLAALKDLNKAVDSESLLSFTTMICKKGE